MSPSIPILLALLLALISGSTGKGGQRIPADPVALLRQTLRYWRKIYNTYHEEVALGYCWADYLLEISDELSRNLSASLSTIGDGSDTTTTTIVGATRSQQNAFPENVMADATRLREESRRKHSREKRSYSTAEFTVSNSTKNPDGCRIASRWEMFRKQQRRITSEPDQHVVVNNVRENNKTDGNKRITLLTNSHVKRRRRALPITSELSHEEQELARDYEFSSHATNSRIVNPTPNPEDDDKLDSASSRKKEADRKLLRPVTSHRSSFVGGASATRNSFSLKVFYGGGRGSLYDGHRFPFRRYLSFRERNSRVSEPLSELELENRGTRRDFELRRASFDNDNGSSTTPPPPSPSRLQFRRINAGPECRIDVVKLMDSEKNSSRHPTRAINSETPRQKPGELSRDTLLSYRVRDTAERSLFESRGSGREAVKRYLAQFETRGGDTRKRRYPQSRKEKRSQQGEGNILSVFPREENDSFSSGFKRLRRQIPHKNRGFLSVLEKIPKVSRKRGGDRIRIARSASSLHRVRRFMKNYVDNENSSGESSEHSKSNVPLNPANRDRRSLIHSTSLVSGIQSIIVGILRTLGMFVLVGRQIIDIVESNTVLVCTKEYFWIKIIKWIDM